MTDAPSPPIVGARNIAIVLGVLLGREVRPAELAALERRRVHPLPLGRSATGEPTLERFAAGRWAVIEKVADGVAAAGRLGQLVRAGGSEDQVRAFLASVVPDSTAALYAPEGDELASVVTPKKRRRR